MRAPKVIAKGTNLLAQRIKEIARANRITIVENPPLARVLYQTVDLDQEIHLSFTPPLPKYWLTFTA